MSTDSTALPTPSHSAKTVLVTGAGSGIGAATARALVDAGHKVAVADINLDSARRVAKDLGTHALPMELDVRDADRWADVFDEVSSTLGEIDVLVNNAGIIHTGRAGDIPLGRHRDMIDVNFTGPMTGMLIGLARMKQRGSGHLITVCSMTSFTPLVGYSSYSASKHALRAFHHSVAIEELSSGIAFSIIHPPSTRTPMLEQEMSDETSVVAFAGKSVAPEVIADAVVDAIDSRPVEVVFPRVAGRLQRLLGANPGVTYRAVPRTAEAGSKNRQRILQAEKR